MSKKKQARTAGIKRSIQGSSGPSGPLPEDFIPEVHASQIDDIAHLAEQDGLSITEKQRLVAKFLNEQMRRFNRPRVGRKSQDLRDVFIMHWVEILRAKGLRRKE